MSQSSSTSGRPGQASPMYFCHSCGIEIRPLMTPNPTCPRCNDGFVEEMDASGSRPDGLQGGGDEDEDDDAMQVFGMGRQRPFMGAATRAGGDGSGQGLDLGTLLGGVMRGLATAGSTPRRSDSTPSPHNRLPASSAGEGSNNANNFRTGSSQVGPLNFSWGVGSYQSNDANGPRSTETARPSHDSPFGDAGPLGLNEFVRRSFDNDFHHHDDGMGGAGAAADGRFFNMDNRTATDRSEREEREDGEQGGVPAELDSIRDMFSSLFGGLGDGPASMLVDLFGGGRGRTGDYVWGQQGLDDVISQLMEQTRGSTAPPPASEEAIARLDRFSRGEISKVRQARNRECSTCMDSFEEEEEGQEGAVEPSLDSNRLSSTIAGDVNPSSTSSPSMHDDDDPPETIPTEEQQDELMMMPCKHLFHVDCLLPWLRTNGTCPVCRVSLEPEKANKRQDNQGESTSAGPSDVQMQDDTDEDESVEAIRARSRRAAEARMGANLSDNEQMPRVPGSFLQPDELD